MIQKYPTHCTLAENTQCVGVWFYFKAQHRQYCQHPLLTAFPPPLTSVALPHKPFLLFSQSVSVGLWGSGVCLVRCVGHASGSLKEDKKDNARGTIFLTQYRGLQSSVSPSTPPAVKGIGSSVAGTLNPSPNTVYFTDTQTHSLK